MGARASPDEPLTPTSAHTYRSTSGSGCYWERLSGLTGELDDLFANDRTDEQAYIKVLPTDVAFSTEDCGTWSRTG